MPAEQIVVVVGGTEYYSWLRINVRAAYHEACRSFDFTVAAEQGAAVTNALFEPGTPLDVYASGDQVFSGFVNRRKPKSGPRLRTIVIAGRSKGQDHCDCTAIHATGTFENMDPVEIANATGQFATQIRSDRNLDKLDFYQMTPGETVFDMVDDLLRDQGMTLCGQPDGSILATDASQAERHAGQLIEGWNVEEIEGDFSDENRHSEVHVRGQHPWTHGDQGLRLKAMAPDSSVQRYRPYVHHHHGRVTQQQLMKRAQDLRNRKAGHSCRASCKVPTWRDDAGSLWTPGRTVFTTSDLLALSQDMLIESADYSAEAKSEGTVTNLALVDPSAYGGQAGKGAQSGGAWAMDSSQAA